MGSDTTVAVVGSGISGLSIAWLLNRSGYKVTLYEKEVAFGGHTLTEASGPVPVDLGFQVFNLTTYPNLVGFFDCLGVDHEPSEMSFSCSVDDGQLEWGSEGLSAVFAQRRNLVSWKFLRMIYEVVRFGQAAPKILESDSAKYGSMTLGEYIEAEKYSETFRNCYLMPMCASVWSVSVEEASKFPVVNLVQFWVNHHLLDIFQRPRWRVVKNQGQAYVKKVIESLPDVRSGQAVLSVVSGTNEKLLVTTKAGCEEFDKVVLATHSDISMELLGAAATNAEKRILSSLPYQKNTVYYHTDDEYMPRRKSTWSSWNFIGKKTDSTSKPVSVTYWCNRLQNLPNDVPDLFVTLNPSEPPAASKIIRKLDLHHNLLSLDAIDAQTCLDEIQGKRGIYFAGAWCGYGFHEDGIKSAVRVAEKLGATVPWTPRTTSPKMSLGDYFYMRLFGVYAKSAIKRGHLRIILPNGDELVYGNQETENSVEAWRGAPALQSTLRVFDMGMFKKCVTRHDTGLAEAFMDGDYEATSLGGLMAIAATNASELSGKQGLLGLLNWVGKKLLYLKHKARSNTILGSRNNIKAHYDAGNEMYRLFLDKSMTYSCGIHSPGASLHDAQLAKLDALIQMAKIKSSDHVLEIGCGWGSFAIRAAQSTGCRVTGLTLSQEQLNEAQERVKCAGLDGQVNLIFCDYRESPGAGTYDKLVSCEMIEAVGEEHLDSFFKCIGKMLKPGGVAVLQAISVPDERYKEYCNSSDFIRDHIFPGGHLVCLNAILDNSSRYSLRMLNTVDIGPDYAITLRAWRSSWEAKKAEALALGYSESFWRMYSMYFAYCEGAFDAKYIKNYQICLQKDLTDEGSLSCREQTSAASSRASSIEADSITQVLLAVYFFLAGLACGHHWYLWITPISTVMFTALSNIVLWLSSSRRFYSRLSHSEQLLWCDSLVQLIFSGIVASLSISQLKYVSSSATLEGGSAKGALYIICGTMGFAGYQLWRIVSRKLYHHRTKSFWYFTMLLCLFATAAFKQEHTSMLASLMIGEWCTVLHVARRLFLQAQSSISRDLLRLCVAVEWIAFLLFRFIPHALMFLTIVGNQISFQSPVFYWMALGGITVCNLANFHQLREALCPATGRNP